MRRLCFAAVVLLAPLGLLSQDIGGPKAEKRFPPLQVPAGFKATLFACDPMLEYPSVIATGPRVGTLLVAIDFMTGLGADIVRRDEIRLLEDRDRDGYADSATVLADGFNSIQGLTWHQDVIYVMHAPFLTALRVDDKGKVQQRRDLFSGIGLPPEKDQIRLHNANGVTAGHDGWLYLAVGDRGVNITRPEGDKLILEGGGILRCRPDGRDLHIFATGLRNIYDVALDEDLNVFIRDNENDGGTYKVRMCHSFFGADHGYPYRYEERPDEALPPLADLGLGSSAGGVCYLETQFPREYHGNLFFCEWGRALARYQPERAGSSFAPLKEIDFATGAANDPYGFKPTDVVVGRDGSLFVSDWGDGQRPKRGRGRIYQIRALGSAAPGAPADDVVARLDSASYWERIAAQQELVERGAAGLALIDERLKSGTAGVRARLHAVWIIAAGERIAASERLFRLAEADPATRVQAQAIRALGDLHDPVLVKHQLGNRAGDVSVAERIAAVAVGRDAGVQREALMALGRLRWPNTPAWLAEHVRKPDAALEHAAQWALRQTGNWPAILQLIDRPIADPVRTIAVRAAAEQFDSVLIDGLIQRLRSVKDGSRQREYADLLTRVYKKPGPWEYWGFRPKPRAANTVTWEKSAVIAETLEQLVRVASPDIRRDVVRRMLREQAPLATNVLAGWLQDERSAENVAVILAALAERPSNESRPLLEGVIRDRQHSVDNRRQAVAHLVRNLDADSEKGLLAAAEAVEEGVVLADLMRALGQRKLSKAGPFLLSKADSTIAEVRAAFLDAAADLPIPEAGAKVPTLLRDKDGNVRSAAAHAAGKLGLKHSADVLLQLTRDSEGAVRRASLDALRRLREPRGVPIAVTALDDAAAALKALELLGDLGGPEHSKAVAAFARRQPTVENLTAVGKVLAGWSSQKDLSSEQRREVELALAEIHGSSGQILAWQVLGPTPSAKLFESSKELFDSAAAKLMLAGGIDARVDIGTATDTGAAWLLGCAIAVPEETAVEFFTSSTGLETVRLNGLTAFQRDRPGIIGPYPDRFEGKLARGVNQLLIQLTGVTGKAQLQFRFRRKSGTAEQERFTLAALSRAGNPAHGKEVFLNAQKSQCIKCHRVGEQGERIGPELTGLGSRFPKVYIVESILQPSRTIAPSYETTALVLKNGTVLTGVKIADSADQITVVDNQANKHVIPKNTIEEQQRHPLSTMPDGLERALSEDEFVDLISFLVNLKESR